MYSNIKSCGLLGIDGYVVDVETYISSGIPSFDIVGLGDATIRESRERVRAAIKNSGYEFPIRRITMNLAPANIKKEGSQFDLPVALGILASSGVINTNKTEKTVFVGELSLDGQLKPVKGILPMVVCAMQKGFLNFVLPAANADEASVVKNINIIPVKTLKQAVLFINQELVIDPYLSTYDFFKSEKAEYHIDFSDVKGQENAKRALEVAASGGHNCLMIGSPGAGKTMLARRLPTIMPALTFEEALEVTKIHSIAGILPKDTPLVKTRPFRSPHHTISETALVGGGAVPKPGEISLSHYGVLFLDEMPEFSKKALEVLRQPLEDGFITISRVNTTLTYPAKTMLVGAANPCRCGKYLDDATECTCTPRQIQQYLGKISGPLLDRMDIHIEVASVKYKHLDQGASGEPSFVIRERVERTRRIQLERYKSMNIFANSQLEPAMISKFCQLDDMCRKILSNAFEKLGLSARAYNRILKVARTIADMEESESIRSNHLAEAIQYRSLDRRIWGI